jgi:two-component system phosphate regulon sensor histidine kinase PhoR
MRLLPAGIYPLIMAAGLTVVTGALRGSLPLTLAGTGLLAAASGLGLWWVRRWVAYLRRWLQGREGTVTFVGDNGWQALESEIRYHLKHMDRRLEEADQRRRRLEELAQELPLGMAVLDSNDRLREANPAGYRLLGLDPQRDRGMALRGWLREPDLQPLFSDSGPVVCRATASSRWDPTRTLSFTRTRLPDGYRLLVVEEITERVRLQRMREDFVANVSHELKSPLTSLSGFTETLLDAPDLPTEQRQEFLGIMEAQIRRMQSLVDDLLTLSRLEAQTPEPPAEPTDLGPLLSYLADQYDPLARESDQRLSFAEPEAGLPPVRANPDQLTQALGNLVDNALKYSPRGGGVTVTPSADPDSLEVRVTVTDSGPGIDPRHIPRLTERFYRVDKGRSREVGGTGLGLSIVKHILEPLGGRLEIDSTPGKGSAFTAVLPTATPEPQRGAGDEARANPV